MSRGSRGPRSRINGILQPFRPLLLSWYGRGDMPSLRGVDAADVRPPALKGKAMMSGMYLNELLVRLLHRNDIHQDLFGEYHESLYAMQDTGQLETILRYFEKNLLEQLGFGLNLDHDADSGAPVGTDRYYAYHLEHGPVQCQPGSNSQVPVLAGCSLLDFTAGTLDSPESIADIKRLMRYVIQHHLGSHRLKSRELFRRNLKS